jgi:uncharacterized protein with PQ loop repeat
MHNVRVTLQNVLGIVASTLSMLFIWPQVILVYRRNTVEGLSPIGALQGICGSTLWSVYGLSQGDVAVGGSNFLIVVAIALLARAMVKHGTLPASRLYATVFAVTAFAFICVSVSPGVTGFIAFVVGASSVLPQTFTSAKSDDLSGVSLPTYVLLFFTAVAWSAYGFIVKDALVVLPNVVVIPCAIFIGAKIIRTRKANVSTLVDVA